MTAGPLTDAPGTDAAPAFDPQAFDPYAYAAAAAGALGLSLDPAWIEGVAANLRVLHAAARTVEAFPLPDEAEAAPVFSA